MPKTTMIHSNEELGTFLKGFKGDPASYRHLFDLINREISITEGMIVTFMPRGSLQIVQPLKVPEPLLKGYGKGLHAEDTVTWQAIARQASVRAADAFGEGFESSRYFK